MAAIGQEDQDRHDFECKLIEELLIEVHEQLGVSYEDMFQLARQILHDGRVNEALNGGRK